MTIIDKTDLARGLNFEWDVMSTVMEGPCVSDVIKLGITHNPVICHEMLKRRQPGGSFGKAGRLVLIHECRDLIVIKAELSSLTTKLNRLLERVSSYRVEPVSAGLIDEQAKTFYIYAWIA